jgi:hypothetical protein
VLRFWHSLDEAIAERPQAIADRGALRPLQTPARILTVGEHDELDVQHPVVEAQLGDQPLSDVDQIHLSVF